jgi:DNA-binding SARP family transcriptional activator
MNGGPEFAGPPPGQASGFQVRLLGVVEVAGGGQVVSPPPLLRTLLAVLALSANRVVSSSSLIEALWQEEPSPARERNLHAHVYQLRKLLAGLSPDQADNSARLVTRAAGYLLRLGVHESDFGLFTDLAQRGREAVRAGDNRAAAALLGQALGVWQGSALEDVASFAARLESAAAALDEDRLAVHEDYAEVRLALGLHRELVGELALVAAEHPLRERLCWLLMLALYRSGRQAEALERYRKMRSRLADELGIDPSPSLQELHQRILQADPALMLSASAEEHTPPRVSGSTVVVPRQLPPALRQFAGREAEIKRLDELVGAEGPSGTVLVTAIGGSGGIGKTTLALHWAHRVADRFPDGQLHVNLRGFDPSGSPRRPAEVITGFLEALGLPAGQLPHEPDAQAGLYRSMLTSRRMLIVLDNAADADQVRPLLPAASGCLVIVTSRSPLTGLVITDGALPVPLDVVTSDDAVQILAARLGSEHVAGDPGAVTRLVDLCARMPLALAIAAARAAAQAQPDLGGLAAQMAVESRHMDALDSGEAATSVQGVFSWSYGQLSGAAARMFRLLGLHCGPDVTTPAAASLAGVSRSDARASLGELVAAGLIMEHRPGRYTFHDLLRSYAASQAHASEPGEERSMAIRRSVEHYLHSIDASRSAIQPSRLYPFALAPPTEGMQPEAFASKDAAIQWQRDERQVLLSAVSQAARARLHTQTWQLARYLGILLSTDGRLTESTAMNEVAVAAADQGGDITGMCVARLDLAHDLMSLGKTGPALPLIRRVVELAYSTDDESLHALAHLRMALWCERAERYSDGLPESHRALALYRKLGNRSGQAYATAFMGDLHMKLGDFEAAVDLNLEAAEIFAETGNSTMRAECSISVGCVQLATGNYGEAAATLHAALEYLEEEPDVVDRAVILMHLGRALRAGGDEPAARDALHQSLETIGDVLYTYNGSDLRAQIKLELATARLLCGGDLAVTA